MTLTLEQTGGNSLVHAIVIGQQDVHGGLPARVVCRPWQCQRRREEKRAAFARLAFEPYFAAHQLHKAGNNRQTQPRAAVPSGVGPVHLSKRLENELMVFRRDSYSGIGNTEMQDYC